jgi:hypothetical protein
MMVILIHVRRKERGNIFVKRARLMSYNTWIEKESYQYRKGGRSRKTH